MLDNICFVIVLSLLIDISFFQNERSDSHCLSIKVYKDIRSVIYVNLITSIRSRVDSRKCLAFAQYYAQKENSPKLLLLLPSCGCYT